MLREDMRTILSLEQADAIYVVRIYLYKNEVYIKGMSTPKGKFEGSLWAWRTASNLRAYEDDPFMLPGEAKGKHAVLKDAEKWSTNVGHPGPANPAVGEVFSTFVIPNMFANASRGMKPDTAVEQAELLAKAIFAKWRKKGFIGGTK